MHGTVAAALQNSDTQMISTQEKRELVARILKSRWFNKSDRLSSFLLHICELDLQGRAQEISEYQIGRAIFERPENYDPSADGIVRSHASRLRMRLGQYYSREGRSEAIRLTVPRGGYLPCFTLHDPDRSHDAEEKSDGRDLPEPLSVAVTSSSTLRAHPADAESTGVTMMEKTGDAPVRYRNSSARLAWSIVAVFAVLLIAMYVHERRMYASFQSSAVAQYNAPQHPLWNAMFRREEPTTIVVGDSSLVIWQDFMNRSLDLAGYLDSSYRTAVSANATSLQKKVSLMAARRYTSIVDLEVVQSFTRIAQSVGGSIDPRYARDVRPNDLKQGNIILIGTAETNPWVTIFEHDMNFVFDKDRVNQVYSIINRNPQKGEPSRWVYRENDIHHRVYGVVAYLPNLTADANVLLLEGTAMAGTECARDFITDDALLLPFLNEIRRPDGRIPYFEVVLGTDNIDGSAVQIKILAWRIVSPK